MSSIPRKTSAVVRFVAFQKFTQSLPSVSDQQAMNRWYFELRQTLLRLNDELSDAITEIDQTDDDLSSQLGDLKTEVTNLSNTVNGLPEQVDLTEINNAITIINQKLDQLVGVEFQKNKGVASGYASLGTDGIVPASQLPPPPVFDDRLVYGLMGG